MTGVGPQQRSRGQARQPSLHLLTDKPRRAIQPSRRGTREELQVGIHRTSGADQRIRLSFRPRTPRRLTGIGGIIVFETVGLLTDRQQIARQPQVPSEIDKTALEAAARSDAKVVELLAGKTVVKAIVVPGRMVNFVVK